MDPLENRIDTAQLPDFRGDSLWHPQARHFWRKGKHSVRVRSLHTRRLDYLNDIKLCFGRFYTIYSVAVP